MKKQFRKSWHWHPTDTTRYNHTTRCKDRKNQNRRALNASLSRTSTASIQSALPVARTSNIENQQPQNLGNQNEQNTNQNQQNQVPNNVRQNNPLIPRNTSANEPCVSIMPKTVGPLMAITGNPINQNWVIEINKNDPLYPKMIEKIRELE